jgi:predicted MPP superfamily phosphohydrolase
MPIVAGMLLLWELRRGRQVRRWRVGLLAVAVLPAAIGLYATHVEPFRVVVEETTVEVAGIDGSAIRLGVYSDPQMNGISDHERDAFDSLVAGQPDVVLLPGDLFTAEFAVVREDVRAFRHMLDSLDVPALLVAGDHDLVDTLEWLVRDTDAQVLDNEVVTVDAGGHTVAIAGIGHRTDEIRTERLLDVLTSTPADAHVVLAHAPEMARAVGPDHAVDLVVAGDTHGGQVRLPVVGLLWNPNDVPDDVAEGGLHELDGTAVYVSRGVGMLRGQAPQIRLGAPPAVDLITLS